MTDPELRELEQVAADHGITSSFGWVGFRAFEIPQTKPKHVKRGDDGEHYCLRVPRGKDTAGNGGKPRDAYLPPDIEGDIHRYTNAEDIGRDEPPGSALRTRDLERRAADGRTCS